MDLCKHCGQKITFGARGWVHIVEGDSGTHTFVFCYMGITTRRAEPQQQGE